MKNDIEILRCLLQLNIPWQNELTESNDLKKKEIIKNGLLVIDKIIKDSDLKHEEIDILNDALINKHEKMEKARSVSRITAQLRLEPPNLEIFP